jgi:hypothetical protein
MANNLARMFHESPAATADMTVLPRVLGCRTLWRTVQVRLRSNPAVPRDGCTVAHPSPRSRDGNCSSPQQAAGKLRNVRYFYHFIVVRSLTPQQATGDALAGAFS